MSEAGYIAVHRSIWDHERFANQKFSEREAWIWLVSTAAWKDCRVRAGATMVDLKRGELLFSTRFLAKKWKWSQSIFVWFLILLKNDSMIGSQKDHNRTHITICNYDRYQISCSTNGSQSGSLSGSTLVHSRFKEEEGNKIIKDITPPVAKATRGKFEYSKEFEEAWQGYPARLGGNPKHPAAKLFLAAIKGGADPQSMIEAVKRYAVSEQRNIGTPFIPQMVKWLRDGRWTDYGPDCSIVKFDVRKFIT